MPRKCYIKPNRKEIRHFDERAAGRVIAYARRDGADDALLIAYILQAFGIRVIGCLIYRILDILNTTFFLSALITLLNGIVLIAKGLKLVGTLKRATIPGFLEIIVPKKYLGSLGQLYLWTGIITAGASALTVFLTAISNSFAVYLLMRRVCEAETTAYKIESDPLDIGELPEAFDEIERLLEEQKEAAKE